MSEFMEFESQEAMLAWMAERRKEREERAKSLAHEQETFVPGDHAVRFLNHLVIFIEVTDLRDIAVGGQHYSHLVPDGEYGSTDKAIIWPIDPSVFVVAKAYHFDVDRLPAPTRLALGSAYADLMEHVGSAQDRAR